MPPPPHALRVELAVAPAGSDARSTMIAAVAEGCPLAFDTAGYTAVVAGLPVICFAAAVVRKALSCRAEARAQVLGHA